MKPYAPDTKKIVNWLSAHAAGKHAARERLRYIHSQAYQFADSRPPCGTALRGFG